MACVNVPSHALAPISRLMAAVWGKSNENHPAANFYKDQKVSFTKPRVTGAPANGPPEVEQPLSATEQIPAAKTEKMPSVRRTKEVRIDATTMVPTDLYWSLLRAGERAKNGGQHRLKDHRSSRGVAGQESPRPHLVRVD
eukprot:TRINITY_DN95039_c0_g1_i1.p2 TRINITY_DN95039_c0_g1~~TRINITY_DN95039_c0_g1_i1.p2  ORF type:complete len:159 (+),score=22.37 TRINITY_DN95039_c0_g1_i1:58-477(+)